MNLFLLSALVAMMAGSATAKPIDSCDEQAGCMKFTKTKMPNGISACTGDCVFKVCLTFDFSKSGCQKSSSDTISHVCDMADNKGCMRSGISFDPDGGGGTCSGSTSGSKCSAPTGFSMCQYGKSGDTLRFVVKDGNDGNSESKSYSSSTNGLFLDSASSCDKVSCANGNDTYNCGGAGTRTKERIWAYKLEPTCTNCATIAVDPPIALPVAPPVSPPVKSPVAAPVTPPVSPPVAIQVDTPVSPPVTPPTPPTLTTVCREEITVLEVVKLFDDANSDGNINPGDTVEYSISLRNEGTTTVAAEGLMIVGPLNALAMQNFVPGSCSYTNRNTRTTVPCADDSLGSDGLKNPFDLPANNLHIIQFKAKVDGADGVFNNEIANRGIMDSSNPICPDKQFTIKAPLAFEPKILLIKSAYLGHNVVCENKMASSDDPALISKLAQGVKGTDVSFCYQITNTGSTYLDPKAISDPDLSFISTDLSDSLAPGDSIFVKYTTIIAAPINTIVNTEASVPANPIYFRGDPIPDLDDVTDTSSAGVKTLLEDVDIDIQKTVHLDHWDRCSKGQELEQGLPDSPVTYCYLVTNTGKTHLTDLVIADAPVSFTSTTSQVPSVLAPGDSFYVGFKSAINSTLSSPGVVTGTPSDSSGSAYSGAENVTDSDPAGVFLHQPQNQVHCPPGGYVGMYGIKN